MLTFYLCSSLATAALPQGPSFHPPQRLAVGDAPIRVEEPGYACPSLFDVDRDGVADLVVGQFQGGKMHVYKGQGKGTFGKGDWIKADGNVAEVPGVW